MFFEKIKFYVIIYFSLNCQGVGKDRIKFNKEISQRGEKWTDTSTD